MPDPTHNAQQCAQIMKPMNLLDTRRTTWQQLQDASTTDYCIVMIEII